MANRALKATLWDEKLVEKAGMSPMGDNVGNVLFWLVILMFLPAVLGVMQLDGMLDPVRNMVSETLAILPNIFAAAIIVLAGWLVAKILRGLVTNLLAAVGAEKLGESAGMQDRLELSKLAGLLVFILVFVPVMIAALDALQITAISGPATEMLGLMMQSIPNIFAAVLILFIQFGGDVLLGVGILLIGFWLANLAHRANMRASGGSALGMASIARYAILGLVVPMGLSAMGIADEIVNLAFLLVFGAVAVAIALSFGLGGREAAGKQMEHWLAKLRKDKQA
ncbi:MAG: mechanosensitive ion channel [Thiobacillus sp.]|nr:mechanosensitive ion channel [Thiobacillus sp.]